jgi:hypothetical protein
METVIPECNNLAAPASSTNLPCWAVETDPMCTTSYMNLTLKVERPGGMQPPKDDHVVSYCVTLATCAKDGDCGSDQVCRVKDTTSACSGTPGQVCVCDAVQ